MSSRRTLILIGAIAIGAFAAFALLNYVRGVEESVYEDRQPVEVLVAGRDIPAGTPSAEAQALFERREIPLDMRPATFIRSDGLDQIAGLIARSNIPANQIIVEGMFVDGTVIQQSFKDRIPSGQVAISLPINPTAAVGGRLQPGDEVNLMVLHENQLCDTAGQGDEEGEDADAPSDTPPDAPPLPGLEEEELIWCTYANPARYVLQRLEILAIGDREQLQPGEEPDPEAGLTATDAGVITFMVPNDAAQILASVDPADVYLTLLPEDYSAETLPAFTIEELFGPTQAETPEQLTPYGPDGYVEGDAESTIAEEAITGSSSGDDEEG